MILFRLFNPYRRTTRRFGSVPRHLQGDTRPNALTSFFFGALGVVFEAAVVYLLVTYVLSLFSITGNPLPVFLALFYAYLAVFVNWASVNANA